MTRNLAAARRKGDPANGCCVEAEELWQLELGRCYKIGKAGGGVPSYGVHVGRHAKKYLRTVGHSHTYECLRSFDYVGPLLGAPGDTVLKLNAPGRDRSWRTGEIR